MAEMDHGEAHDDAVTAGDHRAPEEIRGPESEVDIIVRRASPARLGLRLILVTVLLAGAAAGAWRVHAWWAERSAAGARGDHGR
jgi:hypothetical protein